jgi:type VI secretion system protein VasD
VIGVVAAFRNLPRSVWRATWPLPATYRSAWYRAAPKVDLKIGLDANAVVIVDGQQNR